MLYATLVTGALVVPVLLAPATSPLVALALLTGVLAIGPLRAVLGGATGPQLIPALKATGLLLLVYGLALGALLALA
ncbi:MAG TPA: hypothetical protein DCQ36_05855 [Actinobacteria bacterium]|nr:hypothetical protein [Actinomycetota bacterium]